MARPIRCHSGRDTGETEPIRWSARFAHWLPPTAIYLAYIAVLSTMCFAWLPRIISRRMAHQLRTDPGAVTRQQRQRYYGIAGFVGGALAGGIGLFAGLWTSGLLPWP